MTALVLPLLDHLVAVVSGERTDIAQRGCSQEDVAFEVDLILLKLAHSLLPALALVAEQVEQTLCVLQPALAQLLIVSQLLDEVTSVLQVSLHILDVLLDSFDLCLHLR